MTLGSLLASLAGAYGAGMLYWKYTKPWRDAALPGPTEGNARYKRIELITIWCSIGSALVGMVATARILIWMGFH